MNQTTIRRIALAGMACMGLGVLTGSPAKSADSNDASVAAAVTGGIIGAAALAAYVKSLEEQLEHYAVERLLELRPDLTAFELSLVSFDVTSVVDLSSVRAVPFVVRPADDEPFVLMLLFDEGWVNANGLDLTLVSHRVIDRGTWNRITGAVVLVASGIEGGDLSRIPVYDRAAFRSVKLVDEGSKVPPTAFAQHGQLRRIGRRVAYFEVDKQCLRRPLLSLGDDEYRVQNVTDVGRVLYNERSVHLYLEEFSRLVRLKRSVIDKVDYALFPYEGACEDDIN